MVAARLEAVEQPLEILPQVLGILRPALAIHAHRSVFACAPKRFVQELTVDVVGKAQQCPLRCFPRQFCYPLQFR
jgi:hypothetical protein